MPVTDRARAAAAVLGIVLVALALRTVWLRADPPTYSTGVVWHDEGAWTQLELYIRAHTGAEFSHGLCEPCTEEMYPEIYAKLRRSDDQKK